MEKRNEILELSIQFALSNLPKFLKVKENL